MDRKAPFAFVTLVLIWLPYYKRNFPVRFYLFENYPQPSATFAKLTTKHLLPHTRCTRDLQLTRADTFTRVKSSISSGTPERR